MRRTFSFVFALGLGSLALACGGSSSSGPADAAADGGGGGCGELPPIHCTGICGAPGPSPDCVDGTWRCQPEPAIACVFDSGLDDGGSNDAGAIPVDASFACMGLTCNATTQYCSISGGGAQPLDGGSNMHVSCPALPAMPCDAGTGCACIPDKCSCTEDAGAITNECLYP